MIINPKERALPLSNLLFILVWFSLSLVPLLLYFKEQKFFLLAIFLTWIAIGFMCIVYDFVKFIQWRLFGDAQLMLDSIPVHDGELVGYLIFKKSIALDMHFTVKLLCKKIQKRKNEIDKWDIKYETIASVYDHYSAKEESPGIYVVAIRLTLPEAGMPTDLPRFGFYRKNRIYFQWELEAKAVIEGFDFNRTYPIKVL